MEISASRQFASKEGLISFLTSSHELHQRAPHGMRWEDGSLDVAWIQLSNCPSEESPGRQADLVWGDQREEESEWPGPFMCRDNTRVGTCCSWGGRMLRELHINRACPGPVHAASWPEATTQNQTETTAASTACFLRLFLASVLWKVQWAMSGHVHRRPPAADTLRRMSVKRTEQLAWHTCSNKSCFPFQASGWFQAYNEGRWGYSGPVQKRISTQPVTSSLSSLTARPPTCENLLQFWGMGTHTAPWGPSKTRNVFCL